MAAAQERNVIDIKTLVLNDLDGGRGSGLPRKPRSKLTTTLGNYSSSNDIKHSKSSEFLSPRPYPHFRPKSYHPSMENLRAKTPLNITNKNKTESSGASSSASIPEEVPKVAEESELEEIYDYDDEEDGQLNNRSEESSCNGDNSSSVSSFNVKRNGRLHSGIESEERTILKCKIACGFAFEAMRRHKREVSALEEQLQKKKEQVAARVILHNLLLNSWRLKSSELSVSNQQNFQLHKTIDNLCLQLRVVRHLQMSEKEKAVGRNHEFEHLTKELADVKEASLHIRGELEKVREEKDMLLSGMRELSEEHESISIKYEDLLEQKNSILKGSNKNKMRADHLKRENETLARQMESHREQLQQLTKQSEHWQEKALAFESDCWEQKLSIENSERKFREADKERYRLQKEIDILALSKSKAENAVRDSESKLRSSDDEKSKLLEKLTKCEIHLNAMTEQVTHLSSSFNQLKKENSDLKNNLMEVSLQNVRKRRAWGAALYYVFSPIEAIKTLLYGPSSHNAQ